MLLSITEHAYLLTGCLNKQKVTNGEDRRAVGDNAGKHISQSSQPSKMSQASTPKHFDV